MPMIKVFLRAGLGNQIFMIFATVAYALEHNIPYKIISFLNKTTCGKPTYWDTILQGFKNNVDTNISQPIARSNVHQEPDFSYTTIPAEYATKPSNTVLYGFFQSPKYFEKHYEKIIEIMQLRKQIADVKEENKNYFKKKTICLHFRLGDYIYLQQNHCITKPDYYIHALTTLSNELKSKGENIEDYDILYFAQQGDEDKINTFLKVITNITGFRLNMIKVDDSIPDWKQMLMMSSCNHFIIANSTFSWFGAYFSNTPGKIVMRPSVWFGPNLINTHNIKDLFPNNWQVIYT